jgi:hypothetical protein
MIAKSVTYISSKGDFEVGFLILWACKLEQRSSRFRFKLFGTMVGLSIVDMSRVVI